MFLLVIEDEKVRSKLEEIYLYYKKDLYYTAYNILRDHHEAQDVVQTALLKISDHLEKINEIKCKETKGYLVIIVRNLSYTTYNKRKRMMLTSTGELREIDITCDINLEEYILRLDDSKYMAKQLSQLNKAYADILTLRYYYEYTIPEIAKLLDMTENGVSVKIHRAKLALKHLLTNGGMSVESTI